MSSDKHTCRLGPELSFRAPDGALLQGREVEVAVRLADDREISEFVVLFELAPKDYARVDEGALFHLDGEARGPVFGGRLAPDQPVRIEAHLANELLTQLAWGPAEVYGVAATLRGADVDGSLRATESYYARYVTQQDPALPVRTGYKTRWAD